MINLRRLFNNKHRSYLIIFVLAYSVLRLPIFVSSKIENIILKSFLSQSAKLGYKTQFKNYAYQFPLSVNFEGLSIVGNNNQSVSLEKLNISLRPSFSPGLSLNSDVFKGQLSCDFKKGIFSTEIKIRCNANSLEMSEIAQFKDFGLNGPLSFKFSGVLTTNKDERLIDGEFLSQIDSSKLVLPKEIPSIVKLPNIGILDLKGLFEIKNNTFALKETSLASLAGDLNVAMSADLSPSFKELLKLESLLKTKLSPNGIRTVGPWIGLALGGVQFPESGQADIEIKGNSRSGFKGKLVN